MKIAVTGASGFIGTEVLKKLRTIPDVEAVALSREGGRADTPGCVWRQSDFTVDDLKEALQGVEAVIHLAAVRGTAGTIADYHVNETMTEALLLAMGETGTRRIVFASSIAVYSDTETIPWTEERAVEPKTLYGITKMSCEYLCRYYSKKFGFTYAVARVAQVLGTGEKRKAMMNVFLDTAYGGGQIKVMGKSVAQRQYIYVEDLAAVLAQLATETSSPSCTVNVGMEHAYSNLEIAQAVNRAFANETPIAYDDSFAEQIESSRMDVSRLVHELHYRPLDLEAVLAQVRDEMRGTKE